MSQDQMNWLQKATAQQVWMVQKVKMWGAKEAKAYWDYWLEHHNKKTDYAAAQDVLSDWIG